MTIDRILWAGWLGVATWASAMIPEVPAPVARPATAPERSARVPTVPGKSIVIDRAADGLFYLDAKINDARVRFLIDTGANTVVLAPGDAARTGVVGSATRYDASLTTAAGPARMAWARIGRADIAGRTLRNIDVALPASGLTVSLLGQNMLAALGPITLDGDRMILHASGRRAADPVA